MPNQKNNELPFEEFKTEEIAVRSDIRASTDFIKNSVAVYKIKFEKILERPGFNARHNYEGLEELADSIFSNDLKTPLTVDFLKDGRVYVERGHRRLRAIAILKKRFEDAGSISDFEERFGWIECFINTNQVTELDRIKAIYTSNHFFPLSPLENSEIIMRLKRHYNYTHDQISKELGISRQSVDNYAKIAELSEETQTALKTGDVSLNQCLSILRKVKSDEERQEAFQALLSGKGTNLNSKPSQKQPSGMSDFKDTDGKNNAEDDDIGDGNNSTSDEVQAVNECIQMIDKTDYNLGEIEKGIENDSSLAIARDCHALIESTQKRLEMLKKYLIKTQK